jgi:integrase
MSRRLPRYVQGFIDRHGHVRHYFRRKGSKRVPLPGLPWSPEFMAAYAAAKGSTSRESIGAKRTLPGTFSMLIVSYYASAEFRSLAHETRRTRRNILERFRATKTETGLTVGECRVAHLKRSRFEQMVAAKAGKAASTRNFVKTIRALMRFAVACGYRRDDATSGVKMPRVKGDGYATWSEDHISAFKARHSVGTRAYLALTLLLFTAQRRADIVRMGRQHLRDGALHVRQQKTGTMLEIPLHPELRAALEATPSNNLTYLVTEFGKPFSPAGFSNLFRDWCRQAGLPDGYSAHGLRKAACRRLAELGCSANRIMAISGHRTLSEAEKYVKAVDQKRLARAAIETLAQAFPSGVQGEHGSVNPRREG